MKDKVGEESSEQFRLDQWGLPGKRTPFSSFLDLIHTSCGRALRKYCECPGYVLKVKPIGFTNGLSMCIREREESKMSHTFFTLASKKMALLLIGREWMGWERGVQFWTCLSSRGRQIYPVGSWTHKSGWNSGGEIRENGGLVST